MQDWVTVAVGVVLIALAIVLLIAGIVDFLDGSSGPISAGAPILLDRVLLVLILVEIVYTVVLSLRAHRLVAQPFIVVGLIAVVRRILFALTPGSTVVSTAELALLIAMVAVFIAGLVVVSRFEKGDDLAEYPIAQRPQSVTAHWSHPYGFLLTGSNIPEAQLEDRNREPLFLETSRPGSSPSATTAAGRSSGPRPRSGKARWRCGSSSNASRPPGAPLQTRPAPTQLRG